MIEQGISGKFRSKRSDLWLLLALVVAFRLLSLLLLRPGGFIADFSDYYYYYDFAALSDRGFYPFINIWSPYPPLFPWLLVGIYKLTLLLPPWPDGHLWFNFTLGLVMLLAECGNLILVYALTGGNDNPQQAIRSAVFYALLFTPLYTAQAHFDCLPVFFFLLSLWLLQKRHWIWAGIAGGFGFMTKLLPVLLVPLAARLAWSTDSSANSAPAWKGLLWPRIRPFLRYALAFGGITLAVIVPFLFYNPRLLLAPLDIERIRSPWQTIWAVLAGYYGFGVAPADVRNLEALSGPAWQGAFPLFWLLPLFTVLYIWAYLRRSDWKQALTPLRFAFFSLLLLFCLSKGWSPQYLAWLLPFMAILWSDWRGATFALLLMAGNYLESHGYFILLPQARWLLVLTTSSRALLLVLMTWLVAKELCPEKRSFRIHLSQRAVILLIGAGFIAAISLTWGLISEYARERYRQEPARPAIEYLKQAAQPGAAVYCLRQEDLARFYPYLHDSLRWRTIDDRAADGDLVQHTAEQFTADHAADIWLLQRESDDSPLLLRTESALSGLTYSLEDATVAGYRMRHFLPRWSLQMPSKPATFGGQVTLLGWQVMGKAQAGQSLQLRFLWQAEKQPNKPLSAFVHLLGSGEQPLAQADGAPAWPWPEAQAVADVRSLDTTGLMPGSYRLRLGLYTPDDGVRLQLADGTDALDLAEITLEAR